MRHVEEAADEAVWKLMGPEQVHAQVLRQWGGGDTVRAGPCSDGMGWESSYGKTHAITI